uniref:NADH-ubiquinone oxidoreductase chain 3 n=1 Tax=Meira sp. (in: basidiomycete fungi) TaxID=1707708 RepID=A0A7G5VUZ7_9BASI|nr:NADH dehydrogenase subunit 3 [Meira sp. (in: basidiomycete fungi)]
METITLFILFVPLLVVILLVVNLLLAVHEPDSENVTAYECGFQPIYGQTGNPFAISFYVVAMLVLIFDLEILLIFPYASCMYSVQS